MNDELVKRLQRTAGELWSHIPTTNYDDILAAIAALSAQSDARQEPEVERKESAASGREG